MSQNQAVLNHSASLFSSRVPANNQLIVRARYRRHERCLDHLQSVFGSSRQICSRFNAAVDQQSVFGAGNRANIRASIFVPRHPAIAFQFPMLSSSGEDARVLRFRPLLRRLRLSLLSYTNHRFYFLPRSFCPRITEESGFPAARHRRLCLRLHCC